MTLYHHVVDPDVFLEHPTIITALAEGHRLLGVTKLLNGRYVAHFIAPDCRSWGTTLANIHGRSA